MALDRKICIREGCDGIEVVDTTGPYDPISNVGGYGEENDILGPWEFIPDEVSIWRPSDNITDDPFITLPLETNTTPDDEGNYTWSFTKDQLGISTIVSGVWGFEVIGIFQGERYDKFLGPIFTEDVWSKLKPKIDAFDPHCPCNGCTNPNDLFVQLQTIRCSGICDIEKAQRAIDWIYSQIKSCC